MRKLLKKLPPGERGFTLIELLASMAILGILAAVAVPNIARLLDSGEQESYASDLHNIETAALAMLAESATKELTPVGPTDDMGTVQTTDAIPLVLSDYLTVLDGTKLRSGCTYTFTADGTITQVSTP